MHLHAVEHAQQGREGKSRCEHGLHLDQLQIAIVVLQLFFIAFDLLLVLLVQGLAVRLLAPLHCGRFCKMFTSRAVLIGSFK